MLRSFRCVTGAGSRGRLRTNHKAGTRLVTQGGLSLAAMMLLASCALPSSATNRAYRPMRASHRRSPSSVVRASDRRPSGVVLASWYGPGFNGRRTANGETFNQNELSAASKTLPLGSRVRVTNPANGRSVVVRINDRGPYVGRRQLDLSRRAAQQLGMVRRGTARVRVAVLSRGGNSEAASAQARPERANQNIVQASRDNPR
jgi:rare lipoprotein A